MTTFILNFFFCYQVLLMKLADLQNGQKGVIARIHGRGPFRNRITEMGFVRGKPFL